MSMLLEDSHQSPVSLSDSLPQTLGFSFCIGKTRGIMVMFDFLNRLVSALVYYPLYVIYMHAQSLSHV